MSNRQFKLIVVLVVASSLVGGGLVNYLLWGTPAIAASPQVIEAQEFRLVDAEGNLRARLGFGEDGNAWLGLWDAAGKGRVVLGFGKGLAPYLTFGDAAGKERAGLGLGEDGRPILALQDAAGETRAVVGCGVEVDKRTGTEHKSPESTVTLCNADGELIWQAP